MAMNTVLACAVPYVRHACIIAKGHDSKVSHVRRKEISRPEDIVLGPRSM